MKKIPMTDKTIPIHPITPNLSEAPKKHIVPTKVKIISKSNIKASNNMFEENLLIKGHT